MTPQEIKQLRKDLHLTQLEFAEKVGAMSYGTVSQWESGRAKPRAKNIRKMLALKGEVK